MCKLLSARATESPDRASLPLLHQLRQGLAAGGAQPLARGGLTELSWGRQPRQGASQPADSKALGKRPSTVMQWKTSQRPSVQSYRAWGCTVKQQLWKSRNSTFRFPALEQSQQLCPGAATAHQCLLRRLGKPGHGLESAVHSPCWLCGHLPAGQHPAGTDLAPCLKLSLGTSGSPPLWRFPIFPPALMINIPAKPFVRNRLISK